MITHFALEVLAQQQGGDIIPVTVTTPPGSEKVQKMLGVVAWIVFAGLIALTTFSGYKFAAAFSEGTASPGQKIAPLACGVGAIIAGTAASIITFFGS